MMSSVCPLAVTLITDIRRQSVTPAVQSLSFRKTAPGGHADATVNLAIDRDRWPDLGDNDRLAMSDRRTAAPVWDGYTSMPGTSDQRERGQSFDLSAKGGVDRLLDDRRALNYIDQEGTNWTRPPIPPSRIAAWQQRPTTTAIGILDGFGVGQAIATNDWAGMDYDFAGTDMEFGAIGASLVCGTTDTAYQVFVVWSGGSGGPGSVGGATASTSAVAQNGYVNDGTFPDLTDFRFALYRVGPATNITSDDKWAHFSGIKMLGRRRDKFGTLLSGSSGMVRNTYVLASEVVADLIGRMLPWVDPNTATITATTGQIDQLAYRDAVSASQVLDDLTLWEPDMLHEVLHVGASGKHVFNYRHWPTTERYVISTRDGWTRSGSDQGLCNRLIVSYTDPDGTSKTYTATASVPELDNVGRIRHATGIALPAGKGSAANAVAVGAAVLADINTAVASARLVVRRPVLDLLTGRMVQPWEIESGYLVRVREPGDVLRCTQVDFSWARGSAAEAVLTLGKPVLTLAQRIQRLQALA